MIIISQDKSEIFNFNEIFRVYVDSWSNEEFATEPNCFCIKAEKSSDNMICAFFGEYKTEERAKEVLQEIVRATIDARKSQEIKMFFGGTGIIPSNTYYEMPEE